MIPSTKREQYCLDRVLLNGKEIQEYDIDGGNPNLTKTQTDNDYLYSLLSSPIFRGKIMVKQQVENDL